MIRDRNIDWSRKRVFRGAQEFATLVTNATGPVTCDNGASILSEITNAGLGAIKCTATGDLGQDFIPIPPDLDVSQPIYFRVWWTSNQTATTKTFTATLKYKQIGTGTAIAAANTALSTAIAQDLTTGQYHLQKTAWGTLNANTLTDGKWVSISMQAAGTAVTGTMYFLGYEFEYTPLKCGSTVSKMAREAQRRVS